MKKTYLKTILIILLSVSFLVACGQIPASKNNGKSEQYTIVTSFYPIYLATLNVAKNIPNVQVINMTEPQTGCLHDYQLAPKDLKTLENADVFVINGAGMEAFMDKVISQMPELKIIEASQGIKLIKNTTDGTDNVHVWVSITDAILQVKTIGAQLAVADPPHAEEYTKNVAVYVEKLESLKAKMHKELDKLAKRDIVTMHEAFPYFAKEFNLNIVAIVEREPGSAPSAGELAATIEKIKKSGV
ncbi:MAG: zinc ABC transporter substrate-binding protein, partial [Clostridia bacterium]